MLHAYATRPHYARYLTNAARYVHDAHITQTRPDRPGCAVLVAAYIDARSVHPTRRLALIEHGAGQTYVDVDHQGYAGGPGWERLSLALVPGPHAAERWRAAYPSLPVVEFGSFWPSHAHGNERPTVGFTFHWQCDQTVETQPALNDWARQIERLAASRRWRLLGHWHPRWEINRRGGNALEAWWADLGVQTVDVDTLFGEATVLCADNTSLLPEFAATGRPVVWLNGAHYRRDVEHGGRFWDWPSGQVMLDPGDDLATGIETALVDEPIVQEARRDMIGGIFAAPRGDEARRVCGRALTEWVGIPEPEPLSEVRSRTG